MNFKEFGFGGELQQAISDMGFEEPTPVQEKAIPYIQQGRDVIGCAQTGTGKTAAFLLPVLDKIYKENKKGVNALIIVPTRELAMQIDQQMTGFSYYLDITSMAVYGGRDGTSFEQEKKAFTEGCSVIIATPGRLHSHISLGYVNFKDLDYLILDEADRMLDMGFYEDIMRIIKELPKERQTLLFSATMPGKIRGLTKKIMNNPANVDISISTTAEGVHQKAYLVFDEYKINLTKHILQQKQYDSVLIFTSRKVDVRNVERELKKLGFKVAGISSDLDQNEREKVLLDFKNNKTKVLVATDILSRGIDIEDIELVLNYEVPNDAEDYVHRVGRTARAKSTGEAVTFITQKDQYKFKEIEDLIKMEVEKEKVPQEIGKGPDYNPSRGGGGGGRFRGKGRGGGKHQGKGRHGKKHRHKGKRGQHHRKGEKGKS